MPLLVRRKHSLIVLAIGSPHADSIGQTLSVLLNSSGVDIWLYLYDDYEWPDNILSLATRVTQSPKRLLKLEFARHHVRPEVLDLEFAVHRFIWLWDGDAVLDTASFDVDGYVSLIESERIDVSQPMLAESSAHSFSFNYALSAAASSSSSSPSSTAVVDVRNVEVGFMVFERATYERIWWHVLAPHPFKYWCFDVLPFACLRDVAARRVAVVVAHSVLHPAGKHTLNLRGGFDEVMRLQIDSEKLWLRQLVNCDANDCCQYMHTHGDESNYNGCFPIGNWAARCWPQEKRTAACPGIVAHMDAQRRSFATEHELLYATSSSSSSLNASAPTLF